MVHFVLKMVDFVQELADPPSGLGGFSPPAPSDNWAIPNYGDDDDAEGATIVDSIWGGGSDALTGTDE